MWRYKNKATNPRIRLGHHSLSMGQIEWIDLEDAQVKQCDWMWFSIYVCMLLWMLMSAVFISRKLIPRDTKTGKSPVTTLILYSVPPILFVLLNMVLVANRLCSVTNTNCSPNIICHSLVNKLDIVELLSLTRWFLIQNSIIHDNSSWDKCGDVEYAKRGWIGMTIFVYLFRRSVWR